MADTNLVALALAHGFFQRPSQETDIAQLLAYPDEEDEGNSGQLPPLSELGAAFLRSVDRRLVQPAINSFLAPSRALHGNYNGLYLYPDGAIRPYSPEMYDDASAMAGLVGGGGFPMVRSAANPLTSLASRSTRIYDAPSVPQRPFEADYPSGAQVNEAGRLTYDIDGNPLNPDARWVVGRGVVGEPDRPFPKEGSALDALTEALTGSGPQNVAPRAIQNDAGWFRKGQDPLTGNTVRSIFVDRTLPAGTRQRVLMHELGHAIDEAARQVPTEGLSVQLRAVYNDLNNPQTYGRPFGPEQAGYRGSAVQRELMAEAVRAYMGDPNYLKARAPDVAVRIRQYVNQNPRLREIIQFNAGGVPLFGQSAQPDDQFTSKDGAWHFVGGAPLLVMPGRPNPSTEWEDFVPAYYPETGEWRI